MSTDNPFAALAALKSALPPGEAPADPEAAASDNDGPTESTFAPKVIVSRQSKGRGGKTVTVIRGVLLTGKPMKQFVKALRKDLGAAGYLDGEDVVVSGDQTSRVEAFLRARGAKKIILNR